jgi:hypothetical protein
MKCLKGVIIETNKSGLIQVKLVSSGFKFWTKGTPTSRLRRPVLIAWDYIRDEPHDIFTEDDWNIMLSDRTEEDRVFSIPMFRRVEEDEVIDIPTETFTPPDQFWWNLEDVYCGENEDRVFSIPMFRRVEEDGVFSNPLNDEPDDEGSEGHHNCIHI